MQSGAKHLAWSSNQIRLTIESLPHARCFAPLCMTVCCMTFYVHHDDPLTPYYYSFTVAPCTARGSPSSQRRTNTSSSDTLPTTRYLDSSAALDSATSRTTVPGPTKEECTI